jgi:transposase
MRATRDLLRRRLPRMRKRAEWLGHLQQTPRQYHLPAMGQKSASKANRGGGAERLLDPAGHKSSEGALALLAPYDCLLRARELTMLKTATHHEANTRYLLRTVPGSGESLRLGLLSAVHDMERFPRVHDVVSSCRLGKCAKAAAGKR